MNDEKLEKIASVKFRAQEIKDHLQVYFWSNDKYHLKRANKINLQELLDETTRD